MELLSNLQKKEAKVTFDAGHLQVIDINGYQAIQENDMVVCIPYLVERNEILLRYENIPTFELVNPAIDKYITVMSTVIDKHESPEDALNRGLLNEYGLKLRDFSPEIVAPIFLNKRNTSRYYICILPLMDHNYEQVEPTEVKKLEMSNNNISINILNIKNLIIYDLISRYTLDLFKQHYSLF